MGGLGLECGRGTVQVNPITIPSDSGKTRDTLDQLEGRPDTIRASREWAMANEKGAEEFR